MCFGAAARVLCALGPVIESHDVTIVEGTLRPSRED
jgi:hypothetical protein